MPASDLRSRRRRRIRWGVAAVVGSVLAAVPAPATAGLKPYVATDLGARQHPKMVVTHQPGVTYRFYALRWQGWGTSTAQARGRLKACANMAPCEKLGAVTLRLRTLRDGRCDGISGRYYIRGTLIRKGERIPLDLSPSYVC